MEKKKTVKEINAIVAELVDKFNIPEECITTATLGRTKNVTLTIPKDDDTGYDEILIAYSTERARVLYSNGREYHMKLDNLMDEIR